MTVPELHALIVRAPRWLLDGTAVLVALLAVWGLVTASRHAGRDLDLEQARAAIAVQLGTQAHMTAVDAKLRAQARFAAARESLAVARADSLAELGAVLRRRAADALGAQQVARVALAGALTERDSLTRAITWGTAADSARRLATTRADTADVALASEHAARTLADGQVVLWRAIADTTRAQVRSDSVAFVQIRAAVERAGPRCRVLWLVPCPSRRTAFVVGAVLAVAVPRAAPLLRR